MACSAETDTASAVGRDEGQARRIAGELTESGAGKNFVENAQTRGQLRSAAAWSPMMAAPASAQTEDSKAMTGPSAAAVDLVARSVAAQDLPDVIGEVAVLARVATIVRSARLSEEAS